MKKKLMIILPFAVMPIFIPVYTLLDRLIFVDVFECGCVPSVQTNMLHIPFNANDLRFSVFALLTIALFVFSRFISKAFQHKAIRILYCAAIVLINVLWTMWVVQTFMWR